MKYFDYKYSDLQYPVMVNNDGSNVLMGKLEIPLSENVEEVEIPIITINTANIENPEDIEKMVVVERKKVKAYTFFCVAGSEYSRGGDGTEGNPWASINYALHKLQPLVNCVAKYYCCQVYIQLKCSGVCEYYISGNIEDNDEYTGGSFSGKNVFILSDVVLKRKEKKQDNDSADSIHKTGDIGINDCYIKNMAFNGSDFLCRGYDNIIYDSSFTHKKQKIFDFNDDNEPVAGNRGYLSMFIFYGSGTYLVSSRFEWIISVNTTEIKRDNCLSSTCDCDIIYYLQGWRAVRLFYDCDFFLRGDAKAISGEYPWRCDRTGVPAICIPRSPTYCDYIVCCRYDVSIKSNALCKSGDASIVAHSSFENPEYCVAAINVEFKITIESNATIESYPPDDGRYVLVSNLSKVNVCALRGDILYNINVDVSATLKEDMPNNSEGLIDCDCDCVFEGTMLSAIRYHHNCMCNVSINSSCNNIDLRFSKYNWEE